METIKPYLGIAYLLFLLGYWGGIGIILYHLKRFGIGYHSKRMFYIIFGISLLLTLITSIFYMKI